MNAIPSMPNGNDQLVILRCPNCHSAEPIKADVISEGVQVVICRQCGEGWAAKSDRPRLPRSDCEDDQGRSLVWADASTADSVRRPLVGQSGTDADPWALRLESDRDAPEAKSSPVFGWLIVLVSGLFLGGFFGARQHVVAAVPDLAGLYAAIGLPVNMSPLDIIDVRAGTESTGFETIFKIEGALQNRSDGDLPVPALKVEFLDRYARLVRTVPLAAPVDTLRGGAQAEFSQTIADFPAQSVSVRVTFLSANGRQPVRFVARRGG